MKKTNHAIRRLLSLLLTLLLALSLCGCGGTADDDDTANDPVDPSTTDEFVSKVIPWGEDGSIIQQAVDSKSMIICFMSGEGLEISGGSDDSAYAESKWGDSTLIAFPDGQTMLIDGGMSDYGPLLLENLEALGVTKLDYVMLSHRHDDHYGGLLRSGGVLESVEIGLIYSSGIYNGNSSNPAKLEGMAKEQGIPTQTLAKGDVVEIGDVTMEVLWPLPGLAKTSSDSTEDCNNGSLVIRFDYGDTSALFTGDLYKSGETMLIKELGDDIAKLDVDVLKIPHHGRSTSSTDDLIKAASAKVGVATGAIIMETAVYSHYAKEGTAVYMDVYDGYVKVTMDGTNVSTECSRVRDVAAFDKFDNAFGIVRD